MQSSGTEPKRAFGGMDLVVLLLLLAAGAHCTLAIFYDNVSYLNLPRYAAGLERNPYQERIAMVPLLRLAGSSSHLRSVAAFLDAHDRRYPGRTGPECAEPYTAEKLACVVVGLLSVWSALGVLAACGLRRMRSLWWLPPSLALVILYVSYAARYEQNLWYPYDLPHMFLFGSACVCILLGRPRLLLLFFALDLPFRETSVFLIPLTLAFLHQGWKRLQVFSLAGAMALAWIAVRLLITHPFRHNPNEGGMHLLTNLHSSLFPLNWPAFVSILGFLLVPIWSARRYLTLSARLFLWCTLPSLAVTACYSIWSESRVALEWTMPFALLGALELYAAFIDKQQPARSGTGPIEPTAALRGSSRA